MTHTPPKIPAGVRDLVPLWIWVETRHGDRTLADAVRDLSEVLGRRIYQSRVYEWRDGHKRVPEDAARYMRGLVIMHVLSAEGLEVPEDDALERICDRLSAPLSRG